MDKEQKQTHPEVGEDATQYGEFVSSYFAWVSLPKQKAKAKEMSEMTKKGQKKNRPYIAARAKKEPTPNCPFERKEFIWRIIHLKICG